MFDWVLNTSVIIKRFFLLLSIEATILNFPIIFLIRLVFYLIILTKNLHFRWNKIMFETCSPRRSTMARQSCSGFFIDNFKYINTWVGCFNYWQGSVVIICYLDLLHNCYIHGISIFYLDIFIWICLLGLLLKVSVYCILWKSILTVIAGGFLQWQ